MAKDDKTIIVAHTHWDREWYLPFNLFRFRLVAMMDTLLETLETSNEFKFFMLDGQTSILEDYLEIRPSAKERLTTLIVSGRIQIGPYFVQNDPWLQTAEGYVRNLLVGHAISRSFGARPMKIGYIPDQYAHFEQMPQVFRGFEIEAMAFGRGMGNQQEEHGLGFEFEWKAPDGTSVIALHLINGYGQCSGLPENMGAAISMMLFDKSKLNDITKSTMWVLLFSGSDHRLPERVLPAAIRAWNENDEIVEEEGTVQQGTIEEFVANVLAESPMLATYTGELLGARYQLAFQGAYSSCINLKQRSMLAHDLLERYAEPLAIFSRCIAGRDYSGFITIAWKELLKNQAHDSAWTASWNQIMKERDARFDVILQNAEETRNWALLDLAMRVIIDKRHELQVNVMLFNPLEFTRIEPVNVLIPSDFDLDAGFAIIDATGKHLRATAERVPVGNDEVFLVRKFVGSHGPRPRFFYNLLIGPVEMPPLGYTTIAIIPGTGSEETELETTHLQATDTSLENDVVLVNIIENGTLKITDKRNGRVYDGCNAFEDRGDVGDGYEFIPVAGDVTITSMNGVATRNLMICNESLATCKIDVELEIPAAASVDRATRLDEKITIYLTSNVTIYSGNNPRIDVKVEFENNARDHKITARFPTELNATTVQVDSHFGITDRDIDLPDSTGWMTKPVHQAPQHRFVSVTDDAGQAGLLIANKGLPEYEATRRDDGTVDLGLTLLRATCGWLWHINKQSPVKVEFTEAQGKHSCEYCIIPHVGLIFDQAFRAAMAFRYPVHADPVYAHNKFEGHFPNIPKPAPFLLASGSFFELEPAELVLSCVKKAEQSDDVIVRLFNASTERSVQGTLKIGLKVEAVDIVNLEETVIGNVPFNAEGILSSIVLDVPPARIITLKLNLFKTS